ncbi:MAG TPA: hypothetical protein VK177_03015 [Flavobacteriales bacterium]|nr:hypothetical protein [Flavobacteriales bacterium]
MKIKSIALFTGIALFNYSNTYAQGCVAVRQMGGNTLCSSQAYNLSKGEFTVGTTYRYFHSWRHFVGTEEQHERQTTGGGHDANGKELGNAVNIYSHAVDLNISYGLTDRIQFNLSIPYVNNERSQVFRSKVDTFRYSVYASGLADIRFSTGFWLLSPKNEKSMKGNLMLGLGIKTNSGSYTEMDEAPQNDGTWKTVMMDQAIQPGDGGIGFSIEAQGFVKLYKGIYGFLNGYYLFNPKESNGSYKSDPTVVKDKSGNVLGTLTGYNVYACPDQYLARAGFMGSVGKKKNLTFSAAGRFEGIPAYDVFGGQVAYRRPGYVVAVEPGISYTAGKHTFSVLVPYNFIRNRIQSAADIARQDLENSVITNESEKVHVQGDAAFADWSLNFNYTWRIGKIFKKKVDAPTIDVVH